MDSGDVSQAGIFVCYNVFRFRNMRGRTSGIDESARERDWGKCLSVMYLQKLTDDGSCVGYIAKLPFFKLSYNLAPFLPHLTR